MLTQLSIRNILLLKTCDIPFGAGLNVLTGETGAGKSILLDALGLALGERSDTSLIRAGESQASVSAEFEVGDDKTIASLLDELGLPIASEIILRRTLQSDGKSRAFVNDEPVSVAALKRMGEALISRNGQHDQRGLLDAKTHRALLDTAAGNEILLQQCCAAFLAWKEALKQRDALAALRAQAAQEEAWLRQTVSELGALAPRAGEEGELLDLRRSANQAKQAVAHLTQAHAELMAGDGVSARLRQAQKILVKAQWPDNGLESITAALERAETEAEEALVSLENLMDAQRIDTHTLE
ncbi:MAG: hypothetical protein B7X02_01675, partial [Rhodospirillales bacterium 12-54-5]